MRRKKRQLFYFLLTGLLIAASHEVSADIIHVPGQAETIKAGISAALNGDTVMVGVGTYTGFGNRDIDFGGKSIVVRSMKGPTLTIINCEGNYLNPHRGFHVHQGEDSRSVIEGFTIINGFAPFNGPDDESIGGGILCQDSSSPTIIDCVIYDNRSYGSGGGLGCVENSSPTVIGCTFIDNTAIKDSAIQFTGYGGGIRCVSSSPSFQDCVIASNRANIGGGVSCNDARVSFENCEFTDNTADVLMAFEPVAAGVGGGLHLYYSSATLNHCVIDRNMAIYGNNMSYESATGGGVAGFYSQLTISNSTIHGNTAEKISDSIPGGGAGIFLFDTEAQIENSIIAFNVGGEGVGCPYDLCSDTIMPPAFSCSDIFGNEFGDWTDSIAAQEGVNGNFSLDPYFCNPEIGNLNLLEESPCSADSSECGILIGARGVGCMTDVDDPYCCQPDGFLLAQNRPNPFNLSTIIEYTLPAASDVEINVYNTLGQVVRRLVDGYHMAGTHNVSWDGKATDGRVVASGIYFYTIQTERAHQTRRMVLIK